VIQSVQSFVDYFENIRRRTVTYIRVVPAGQLGWSPRPGEFTCAEIVRHLGAAEQMFVGAVVEGRWRYPGHAHD
jgi:DinB family protein